ncbi:hypothetical protein DID78_04080 [Candidatus Marinamargulisbacteria bacterium SCGC AG-343-D04]|nr:hypothetical protein DID78_04080 [Candidatus Marinamargulisbacteria bacterium SCGC AG-343-D04]
MKLKIIDRYIAQELFMPFISGVLAFTTILSGSTILFQLVGDAIKYSIPLSSLLLLIILKLPYVIALSIPMATLFSTISVFGRLGNDLEILALRAHGVSISRLLIPVVIIGICISLVNLWFNEEVVPKSSTTARNLFLSFRDSDTPSIQTNINVTEYKDKLPYRIINVQEKEGVNLKNITVAEYETGSLIRLIRSKTGKWITEGGWEFYNGIMHIFPQNNPKHISIIEFEKELINIELRPADLINRNKNIEEMNRKEVIDKINFIKKTGQDPIKLIMDYHMKVSIAFSSLIYCILGACMGLKPHRSSSSVGIGLSLLIIFGYIILMSIGMGFGLSRILPPILAAWFPNIIIGLFSITLIRKLATQ